MLLSLAPLTLAALDPITFVQVAREAGYGHVGLRTIAGAGAPTARPTDMPCLIDSLAEARAIRAVLDGEGVRARELEFVALSPDSVLEDCRPGLDRGAALGTSFLVAASRDDDEQRRADSFAALADLAANMACGWSSNSSPGAPSTRLPAPSRLQARRSATSGC
jgi:hypothetical protein